MASPRERRHTPPPGNAMALPTSPSRGEGIGYVHCGDGRMAVPGLTIGRFDVGARFARWRTAQVDWRIILFCYLAVAPVVALFLYVRVVPIAWSVVISFYRWDLIRPLKPFIGFANYENLLSDANFILALKNTAVYSIATVVFSTLIALPLAVFLARKGRLAVFYQTVYFLPVITPMVPMAIPWKWIYDYNYALFNYSLSFSALPPFTCT